MFSYSTPKDLRQWLHSELLSENWQGSRADHCATTELREVSSKSWQLPHRTVEAPIDWKSGFRSQQRALAAQNFTMPAMSPTMTEGNIASWKVKEGKYLPLTLGFDESLLMCPVGKASPLRPAMYFLRSRRTRLKWMSKRRMMEEWRK